MKLVKELPVPVVRSSPAFTEILLGLRAPAFGSHNLLRKPLPLLMENGYKNWVSSLSTWLDPSKLLLATGRHN